MKIGVIGLGVVGGTIKFGFEKLDHGVEVHDLKLDTKIINILNTEICYICVPTPQDENGKCDISIIEDTVHQLNDIEYCGIIAIKSTVEPGTTEKLQKKYNSLSICYVPEFLRERCALTDFTENHDVLIIGTMDDNIFKKIVKNHGHYPKKIIQLRPIEAEFVKYFNNVYHATLITLANSFYELCKPFNVEYSIIKNALVQRKHIYDLYLDCSEKFRGFGGPCLPKDLKAVNYIAKEKNTGVEFFEDILKENSKYKTTIFNGMRKC